MLVRKNYFAPPLRAPTTKRQNFLRQPFLIQRRKFCTVRSTDEALFGVVRENFRNFRRKSNRKRPDALEPDSGTHWR